MKTLVAAIVFGTTFLSHAGLAQAQKNEELVVTDVSYMDGEWFDMNHKATMTIKNGVATVTSITTSTTIYSNQQIAEGTVVAQITGFFLDNKTNKGIGRCWASVYAGPGKSPWGLQECNKYGSQLYVLYRQDLKKYVPMISTAMTRFQRKEDVRFPDSRK